MRKILLCLSVLGLAACGKDSKKSIVGPDSAECTAGTIGGGVTRTGIVSASDCKYYDDWFGDTLNYDSYSVALTAGRSYVFHLRNVNELAQANTDDFDTGLTLVGPGDSIVAQSDDDGGGPVNGHNSQLAFVAPVSGVYSLRAHGYSRSDTGSYALSGQDCGRATQLADAPISGALGTSDCIVHNFGWTGDADSSRVDFYRVDLAANQTVTVRGVSSAFSPAVLVSGPGFDAQANIGSSDWVFGSGGSDTTFVQLTATLPGVYTVAIGTNPQHDAFGTTGAYTIDIEPSPAAAASVRLTSAPRHVKR